MDTSTAPAADHSIHPRAGAHAVHAGDAAAAAAPVLSRLGALLAELPGLISDRVQLLSLEVQRCVQALQQLVVLVLAGTILAITAWIALWAGIALAIQQTGLGWPWAVGAVLLLNLGGAVFALMRARTLVPLLALPATVRCLTVRDRRADATDDEAPRAEDDALRAAAVDAAHRGEHGRERRAIECP